MAAGCLDDIGDGAAATAVDGVKEENLVEAVVVPFQVAEDRVDACGGIADEDDGLDGDIQEGGEGGPGSVEEGRILVVDEGVGVGLRLRLVGKEAGLDEGGDSAKRAWGGEGGGQSVLRGAGCVSRC